MVNFLDRFIKRVDATPDPRIQEQAPYQLHFTVTEPHTRIVTIDGNESPLYEVTRHSKLGAWGDKISIKSLADGGKEVALLDFHSIPPRTEIEFPQRKHDIVVRTSDRSYNSSGGLGLLTWKGTGAAVYGRASWELRDASALVTSVTIDDTQTNGTIKVWRTDLDPETFEEVVVVSIAQIEEYKRTIRGGKRSAIGVAANVAAG